MAFFHVHLLRTLLQFKKIDREVKFFIQNLKPVTSLQENTFSVIKKFGSHLFKKRFKKWSSLNAILNKRRKKMKVPTQPNRQKKMTIPEFSFFFRDENFRATLSQLVFGLSFVRHIYLS